jgi:hypothetical protein
MRKKGDETLEVSFTEEDWTKDEEISVKLKEELRKEIISKIDRILVAKDLMEDYDFIFSMVITSELNEERPDDEMNFYNFEVNSEDPQAITILRINPEGTSNIGTFFVSVKRILIPEQETIE